MLLNGMGEGVAEVQEHPLTGIELVSFHNGALDIYAAGDDRWKLRLKILERAVGAESAEEIRILDAAVFGDLSHAVADKVRRKGFQHKGIDEHQLRVIECTDQILSLWKIYRHLAAHGRVYLGQQGGGDLYQPDSAEIACRGEACQVADDSAAEGDDKIAPGQPGVKERLIDPGQCLEALCRFAVGQDKGAALVIL